MSNTDKQSAYDEFLKRFPPEKLQDLTLEEYTGANNPDTFCYWVETKTKDTLGDIRGGNASKFGIYKIDNKNQKGGSGVKFDSEMEYGWLQKFGNNKNDVFKKVKSNVIEIVNNAKSGKFEKIDPIELSNLFKWKIAFLYSNKNLLPIYSQNALIYCANNKGGTFDKKSPMSSIYQFLIIKKDSKEDIFDYSDELWEDYKNSEQRKIDLLQKLKEELDNQTLNSHEKFEYSDKSNNDFLQKGNPFLWVGTKDKLIGNTRCHYEFVFDNGNKLCVMIHFEETKTKKELTAKCKFYSLTYHQQKDWFCQDSGVIDISNMQENEIIERAFEELISLDNIIGNEIKNQLRKYNQMLENEKIKHYVDLLKNCKNLVLTGAPGTGKTFLARNIASLIVANKNYSSLSEDEKKQIEFVQFHQSYDYTDFVEGLRPIKTNSEQNINFERVDGIFKAFCKRALKIKNSGETNSEKIQKAWDILIEKVRNQLSQNKLLKIGKWEYGLSQANSLKYTSVDTPSEYTFTITQDNIFKTYIGIDARPSKAFQKDMNDIVSYMKENCGLEDFSQDPDKTDSNKNYVFIIDEINRGEVSKIFGELFFAIDPGYRGESGKVKTQYSNLVEDEDYFSDGFYVPENVFIIGTMNDIDRSVDSLDFAFRRRFNWVEITAEDSMKMFDSPEAWKNSKGKPFGKVPDNIEEIKNRMRNLNSEICKPTYELGKEYQIGTAYFLKYTTYLDSETLDSQENAFELLWKYNIEPLLREYLRGTGKDTRDLKDAYNNESSKNSAE